MLNKTAQQVGAEQSAVRRQLEVLQARQQALQSQSMRLTLLEQLQRQGVTRPDSPGLVRRHLPRKNGRGC